MLPDWITKFFSVKLATLGLALWFISESADWRQQIIMGTVAAVFIVAKTVQNCVECWKTHTRETDSVVK